MRLSAGTKNHPTRAPHHDAGGSASWTRIWSTIIVALGGTLRGVDGKGVVERAGTKEVVTLATRMEWNSRQAKKTKPTREENIGNMTAR